MFRYRATVVVGAKHQVLRRATLFARLEADRRPEPLQQVARLLLLAGSFLRWYGIPLAEGMSPLAQRRHRVVLRPRLIKIKSSRMPTLPIRATTRPHNTTMGRSRDEAILGLSWLIPVSGIRGLSRGDLHCGAKVHGSPTGLQREGQIGQ